MQMSDPASDGTDPGDESWYGDYCHWAVGVLLVALDNLDAELAAHALRLLSDAARECLDEGKTNGR